MGCLPTLHDQHMTRLTLIGEVNSHTGYGQHLYQVFKYLNRRGVHVSVRAITQSAPFGSTIPSDLREHLVFTRQPEPWELLIAPPHQAPTPGRRTAYFTMWESTQLPGPCVENLNKAEVVLVPCEWNRKHFEDSGVKRPIFIVPLGYDPAVFFFQAPHGSTTFAAAGRTRHGRDRKGLDAVVRAFKAAFPYDQSVRLKIKCHEDCDLPAISDDRIEVTRKHLTDGQLHNWLSACTAFVSAATGEGWGLWQLQAMAMGRPVIASVYGGLTEFLNESNCFPVDYREASTSEHWSGQWAIPDLESMVQHMRAIRDNRGLAEEVGRKAEESVRHLTWDKAGDRLYSILKNVGALPRPTAPKPIIKSCSVIEQCRNRGWEADRFNCELEKDEYVFNPSLAGGFWFFRSSFGPDRIGARIFAVRNGSMDIPLSWRTYVSVPNPGREAIEDPRAIIHEGEFAVSYTRAASGKPPTQEIAFLDEELKAKDVWRPKLGGNGHTPEKNWIWFNHKGLWHVIHWLEPMMVARAEHGNVTAEWGTSKSYSRWMHGVRHGGAHPTLIGDEYFGFCHSLMPWFGRDRSRYYISTYAFKAEEPFEITRFSMAPLLSSEDSVSGNPCSCVIVGGAKLEHDVWTLAVGARDEQALKIRIPHEDILKNMVTV